MARHNAKSSSGKANNYRACQSYSCGLVMDMLQETLLILLTTILGEKENYTRDTRPGWYVSRRVNRMMGHSYYYVNGHYFWHSNVVLKYPNTRIPSIYYSRLTRGLPMHRTEIVANGLGADIIKVLKEIARRINDHIRYDIDKVLGFLSKLVEPKEEDLEATIHKFVDDTLINGFTTGLKMKVQAMLWSMVNICCMVILNRCSKGLIEHLNRANAAGLFPSRVAENPYNLTIPGINCKDAAFDTYFKRPPQSGSWANVDHFPSIELVSLLDHDFQSSSVIKVRRARGDYEITHPIWVTGGHCLLPVVDDDTPIPYYDQHTYYVVKDLLGVKEPHWLLASDDSRLGSNRLVRKLPRDRSPTKWFKRITYPDLEVITVLDEFIITKHEPHRTLGAFPGKPPLTVLCAVLNVVKRLKKNILFTYGGKAYYHAVDHSDPTFLYRQFEKLDFSYDQVSTFSIDNPDLTNQHYAAYCGDYDPTGYPIFPTKMRMNNQIPLEPERLGCKVENKERYFSYIGPQFKIKFKSSQIDLSMLVKDMAMIQQEPIDCPACAVAIGDLHRSMVKGNTFTIYTDRELDLYTDMISETPYVMDEDYTLIDYSAIFHFDGCWTAKFKTGNVKFTWATSHAQWLEAYSSLMSYDPAEHKKGLEGTVEEDFEDDFTQLQPRSTFSFKDFVPSRSFMDNVFTLAKNVADLTWVSSSYHQFSGSPLKYYNLCINGFMNIWGVTKPCPGKHYHPLGTMDCLDWNALMIRDAWENQVIDGRFVDNCPTDSLTIVDKVVMMLDNQGYQKVYTLGSEIKMIGTIDRDARSQIKFTPSTMDELANNWSSMPPIRHIDSDAYTFVCCPINFSKNRHGYLMVSKSDIDDAFKRQMRNGGYFRLTGKDLTDSYIDYPEFRVYGTLNKRTVYFMNQKINYRVSGKKFVHKPSNHVKMNVQTPLEGEVEIYAPNALTQRAAFHLIPMRRRGTNSFILNPNELEAKFPKNRWKWYIVDENPLPYNGLSIKKQEAIKRRIAKEKELPSKPAPKVYNCEKSDLIDFIEPQVEKDLEGDELAISIIRTPKETKKAKTTLQTQPEPKGDESSNVNKKDETVSIAPEEQNPQVQLLPVEIKVEKPGVNSKFFEGTETNDDIEVNWDTESDDETEEREPINTSSILMRQPEQQDEIMRTAKISIKEVPNETKIVIVTDADTMLNPSKASSSSRPNKWKKEIPADNKMRQLNIRPYDTFTTWKSFNSALGRQQSWLKKTHESILSLKGRPEFATFVYQNCLLAVQYFASQVDSWPKFTYKCNINVNNFQKGLCAMKFFTSIMGHPTGTTVAAKIHLNNGLRDELPDVLRPKLEKPSGWCALIAFLQATSLNGQYNVSYMDQILEKVDWLNSNNVNGLPLDQMMQIIFPRISYFIILKQKGSAHHMVWKDTKQVDAPVGFYYSTTGSTNHVDGLQVPKWKLALFNLFTQFAQPLSYVIPTYQVGVGKFPEFNDNFNDLPHADKVKAIQSMQNTTLYAAMYNNVIWDSSFKDNASNLIKSCRNYWSKREKHPSITFDRLVSTYFSLNTPCNKMQYYFPNYENTLKELCSNPHLLMKFDRIKDWRMSPDYEQRLTVNPFNRVTSCNNTLNCAIAICHYGNQLNIFVEALPNSRAVRNNGNGTWEVIRKNNNNNQTSEEEKAKAAKISEILSSDAVDEEDAPKKHGGKKKEKEEPWIGTIELKATFPDFQELNDYVPPPFDDRTERKWAKFLKLVSCVLKNYEELLPHGLINYRVGGKQITVTDKQRTLARKLYKSILPNFSWVKEDANMITSQLHPEITLWFSTEENRPCGVKSTRDYVSGGIYAEIRVYQQTGRYYDITQKFDPDNFYPHEDNVCDQDDYEVDLVYLYDRIRAVTSGSNTSDEMRVMNTSRSRTTTVRYNGIRDIHPATMHITNLVHTIRDNNYTNNRVFQQAQLA